MASDEAARAVGGKAGRGDAKDKDYVTVGSIAATVRRHLESIAPAPDAEPGGAAASPTTPSEAVTGAAMRRFVCMFAMPAGTAGCGAGEDSSAPASPTNNDAAGRDDVLQAKDIERLLKAVGFEPEHKLAIAVNLLLTKCTPSQRAINKRQGKGANRAPRDAKATASELTWLFTQQQDPAAAAQDGAAAGGGGGNTGHTKARRVEPGTPEFLDFVRKTPLMANLRRQFVDLSDEQRALGQTPMSAEEFAALEAAMVKPLEMTFRVHRCDPSLVALSRILLGACDGGKALVPSPLFKNTPAALGVDTRAMADSDYHSAEHAATQALCRNGHSAGAWSFQEAVSMLPVAALGVEPHHRVLDMCAAPGSKSLQVLDAMLRDGQGAATGVLVCNEKERVKARQTLPARLKRSHCPNAVVMRGDGTALPAMVKPAKPDGTPAEQLRFDRIVCDVPCSGDGTARKDSGVWSGWSRDYGESLTKTQRALLLRAIDLLAVGGVVAYSTCSMHVAEDEDVVARALDCYGDEVELLDVNEELRSRGVALRSSGGVPTPFPDSKRSQEPDPDAPARRRAKHQTIKDKVLRVLPHRDDTGGFFVALIRRVQPQVTQHDVGTKLNHWTNGKRFVRVDATLGDKAAFDDILKAYGTDRATFDRLTGSAVPTWLVTPAGGKKKLFLLSKGAAEVVHECMLRKGAGSELVASGIRAFEQLDAKFLPESVTRYRMSGEVVALLGPACDASARRITIDDPAVVKELLTGGSVAAPLFQPPAHLRGDDGKGAVLVGPVIVAIRLPEEKLAAAGLSADNVREGYLWLSGVLTQFKLAHTLDSSAVRTVGEHVFGFTMPDASSTKKADAAAGKAVAGGSDNDEAGNDDGADE